VPVGGCRDSGNVRIRRIDVNQAAGFGPWFAAYDAVQRHDLPNGPRWREHQLRVVFDSSSSFDVIVLAAEDSGETVGIAKVELPLKDNTSLAVVDVRVRPEARRQGIGTALFTEVEKLAVDRGRSSMLAAMSVPVAAATVPGFSFAEKLGFTHRISEIMRVQRAPFQLDRLGELEHEAMPRAEDYEIISWTSPIPDEYVTEYARLARRMSTDAPLGELDYEPETWDVERVRETEARRARMGRRVWATAAVAPDGSLAGMTEIAASADGADDDTDAYQNDTIVDPAHRGHRLGLILKIVNLRALLRDRPLTRAIWTWNAEENSFMISVNEKLGYVKVAREALYQRD
jgi:GNAT superfamily N-acetyltransferase